MFRALGPLTVRWTPWEGEGLEHLTLTPESFDFGAGIRAESVLIGERGGSPYGVHYRIACDAGWTVRRFRVETTDGRCLALASDGAGRWRDENGVPRPDLDGCIDIDLAGSPFTNTLPIRRLNLTPSDGTARLSMVYIPFDTFAAFVDGQRYTCLDPGQRLYRYEAEDRSFVAELPVDEDGLVVDYPGLFRRVR